MTCGGPAPKDWREQLKRTYPDLFRNISPEESARLTAAAVARYEEFERSGESPEPQA